MPFSKKKAAYIHVYSGFSISCIPAILNIYGTAQLQGSIHLHLRYIFSMFCLCVGLHFTHVLDVGKMLLGAELYCIIMPYCLHQLLNLMKYHIYKCSH